MDEALGRQAVASAIEGQILFPSDRGTAEHYRIAREQRNRIVRDEERKAADAAADDWPKVPLREIPEVVALLERWQPKLGLDEAGAGACDDCDKEGCATSSASWRSAATAPLPAPASATS